MSRWKNKQLEQPIKWTGPSTLEPQGLLFAIAPNQAEADEHRRDWENAYRRYLGEQLRKLPLLAENYGVDPSSPAALLQLLLLLAAEVVPGFRLDRGKQRGRPKGWDESKQAELMADIEAVKRRKACSDRNACKILLTTSRYRHRYGGDNPKDTKQRIPKDTKQRIPKDTEQRIRSLHNRLVEARKARTITASLLRESRGIKDYMIDALIQNFGADQEDVKAGQDRIIAHEAVAQEQITPVRNRPRAAKRNNPSR